MIAMTETAVSEFSAYFFGFVLAASAAVLPFIAFASQYSIFN